MILPDLLFTNNKSTLQNVVTLPPLGKSDHDIIYAQPNRVCTTHRKVFVFRKADYCGIKRKLNALFEKMQENSNQPIVKELWNTFKKTLLVGMHEFIPQKMTQYKHCLPWVTINIPKLMCSKWRLHTKLKKTHCLKVLDKYKEMRHTIQREIRKGYWAYIEDIIDYTADINNDRRTKKIIILVIYQTSSQRFYRRLSPSKPG